MRQSVNKDRFIPVRKSDLIRRCSKDLAGDDQKTIEFLSFCEILSSTLHVDYHSLLERLKDNYAPFDTHADTLQLENYSPEQLAEKQKEFSEDFERVLNAANYEKITDQDLQDALSEESLFKVRLEVEFDDFEQVVFYRRGEYIQQETLSSWFGLRKQEIEFTNYDRVAVFIQFKNAEYFAKRDRSVESFTPGSTIIKLFQNVPKADLEMLFPNSEVRMRNIDKVVIGASAAVGGSVVMVTKLGASLLLLASLFAYWMGLREQDVQISTNQLLALGLGLGLLGSFIFKEWSKFKNRKLKFMKALADNLYFKNLDNNAGVFHHLIDGAEEEECKEVILAYHLLLKDGGQLTATELDEAAERWLKEQFGLDLDFEIADALEKLVRFELVEQRNQQYQAVSLLDARQRLDKRWDGLFDFTS